MWVARKTGGFLLQNTDQVSGLSENPQKLRDHIIHRIIQLLESSLQPGSAAVISYIHNEGAHAVIVYKLVDSELMLILDFQEGKAEILDIDFFNGNQISDVTFYLDVKGEFREERLISKSIWEELRRVAAEEYKPITKKRKTVEAVLKMMYPNK